MPSSQDWFVPDGSPDQEALSRTTHLSIAAHQDDLEVIAFHGISECVQRSDRWFTGIVMTDGAGSPRSGEFADYSNDEMAEIRKQEQRQAAELGCYSLAIQYGVSSKELKSGLNSGIIEQLAQWCDVAQPDVVYLHNLADRHDTHISVCMHAIEALRLVEESKRPQQVYGVEVWRSLDWLPERYRIRLDVSQQRQLHGDLIRVFDSQISGGKRYDLASESRHLANATFDQSHAVDAAQYMSLAMDLMPLVSDSALGYQEFVSSILREFESDLSRNLQPCPMN